MHYTLFAYRSQIINFQQFISHQQRSVFMKDSQKNDSPDATPAEFLSGKTNTKAFDSFFEPEPNTGERAKIMRNRASNVYSASNGVIESCRQIIRNESGQANHKPYTGKYQPKPLKDSSSIKPVRESQISWFSALIFAVVVILAISELSLLIF